MVALSFSDFVVAAVGVLPFSFFFWFPTVGGVCAVRGRLLCCRAERSVPYGLWAVQVGVLYADAAVHGRVPYRVRTYAVRHVPPCPVRRGLWG